MQRKLLNCDSIKSESRQNSSITKMKLSSLIPFAKQLLKQRDRLGIGEIASCIVV
jgi:hypothetical protein